MLQKENFSLLKFNTFGIDAHCRLFCEYDNVEELCLLLQEIRDNGLRILHVGRGSNLLFVRDFDGAVLHSHILGKEILERSEEKILVRVGAGEVWDEVVSWLVAHNCYGAENLSLIPGEMGAAAVQNIGAYGAEVGQLVEKVEAVEIATGQRRFFGADECDYAYRHSIFKDALRGKYVVTHVLLRLNPEFKAAVGYGSLRSEVELRGLNCCNITASEMRSLIINVRRAKLPDPEVLGNAGSFFMNPVVGTETFESLLQQYPDMPHFEASQGVKVPAAWLIEQSGWKGRRLGPAGVYEKQALVLVNHGGATGSDIADLSKAVQESVFEKFGIRIFPEVNFIE